MTTIAFDGRFLAADRRVTQNSEITTWACQKLDVSGDPLTAFASTGMIIEGWRAALIEWWLAGRAPGDMPPHGGDAKDIGNLIAIGTDGAAWVVSYLCPYPHRDEAPCAWGSGADYATGAMLAGKSAMEAVAIAAQRDAYTGGGVQFIDIHGLAAGVRDWSTATAPVLLRGRQRKRVAA